MAKYIIIALLGLIVFFIIGMSLPANTNTLGTSTEPSLIECFVNGKSVMATREDCQALSIKPTEAPAQPVVIQQQKPPLQLQPLVAPKLDVTHWDPPKTQTTNCRQFTDGHVECYTN